MLARQQLAVAHELRKPTSLLREMGGPLALQPRNKEGGGRENMLPDPRGRETCCPPSPLSLLAGPPPLKSTHTDLPASDCCPSPAPRPRIRADEHSPTRPHSSPGISRPFDVVISIQNKTSRDFSSCCNEGRPATAQDEQCPFRYAAPFPGPEHILLDRHLPRRVGGYPGKHASSMWHGHR